MTVGLYNEVSNSSYDFDLTDIQVLLKEATSSAHKEAEGHPFLQAIYKKDKCVSDKAYCQYLVDLHHIYQAMEAGIEENKEKECVSSLYIPEIFRTNALKSDIQSFVPYGVYPSQPAVAYRYHLEDIVKTKPYLLIAHAYTRYLGDLAGGQIIKRFISKIWPEKKDCYEFYDFNAWLNIVPQAKKISDLKDVYREILNRIPLTPQQKEEIVREGTIAFEYATEMLEAILKVPNWDKKTEVTALNVYENLCQAITTGDYQQQLCSQNFLNNLFRQLDFVVSESSIFTIEVRTKKNQLIAKISPVTLAPESTYSRIFEKGVDLTICHSAICELGISEMNVLMTGLFPNISSLTVEKNVSLDECQKFYNSLRFFKEGFPQLKQLVFRDLNDINDESTNIFIKKAPNLRSCSFIRCASVTEQSLENLQNYCKFVSILNVSGCPQVKDYQPTIGSNFSYLKELDLSFSTVKEKEITDIVTNHPHIRKLNLTECRGVTDEVVNTITKALPLLTQLQLEYCDKLTEKSFVRLSKPDVLPELDFLAIRGLQSIPIENYNLFKPRINQRLLVLVEMSIRKHLYIPK